MKRVVLGAVLLAAAAAGVLGWSAARRDARYAELLGVGDAAAARGDLVDAVEAFSGAIALKPQSMAAYLKRGEAYRRRGELDTAVRDVRRAADLDPSSTRARELLGDISYEMERFARAADRFAEFIALDDRAPRVFYKLALARYRAGQAPDCVAAVGRGLALDPSAAEFHYLLGLCLREGGRAKEAAAALERAVSLAPAMVHARDELADLYGAANREDDRLAQLEALAGLEPGPAREVALGLAYAAAGDHGSAVQTLGRAARRHPNNRRIYLALGRVWLDQAVARGDQIALGKALEALQVAAGGEADGDALTQYGRALLFAGNAELAERILQQAVQRLPVDPLACALLADAAERLAHFDVARDALIDYQALEPDTSPARRARLALRLADLSLRLDDAASAVHHYERAMDGAPSTDAPALVRYAEARLRTGDTAGARATLEKALALEPSNAAALRLQRRLR